MVELKRELLLNLLAQHQVGLRDGITWFKNLTPEHQWTVLIDLNYMALQAGARSEDVALAATEFGVKSTYTPYVLLTKGELRAQTAKVVNLPENEREKSFRLLLGLLSVADKRRRGAKCIDGCSHWWHQDLKITDEILEFMKAGMDETP